MAKQPQKPLEVIVLRPALSQHEDPCGIACVAVVTHRYPNGYLTRCGGRTPKWYATKDLPPMKQFHGQCWPDFENMGPGFLTKSEALSMLAFQSGNAAATG